MAESTGGFKVGAQLLGLPEVVARMQALATAERRMRPLMKRIGTQIIEPSIRETLRREGRGTWPPERRAVRKHRWLGEQGRIGRTLVTKAGNQSVDVGTTSGYGTWMFGKRMSIPATAPRRARVLRLFTSGGIRFARRTRAHGVTIPARTLWQLWPGDEVAIVDEAARYLDRLETRKANAEGA